jgi:hypothetical protein
MGAHAHTSEKRMDQTAIESEMRLLNVRLLEIEALVAQQQRVIATLDELGRDTKAAKGALSNLLDLQRHRTAELGNLREKLDRMK